MCRPICYDLIVDGYLFAHFSLASRVTLSKMTHFALVIQSRQSHAFAGLKS